MGALRGLLTIVISYLFSGARQKKVWRYSKIIAPLMARTDFAAMYRSLSVEEMDLFHPETILDFLGLAHDDQIFAKGFGEDTDIRFGPGRRTWLESICSGPIDLMSADSGSFVTDVSSGCSSSMGAMHATDDSIAGPELVVVELRRLPKRQLPKDWVRTATVVFELFKRLSNPLDTTRPPAAS